MSPRLSAKIGGLIRRLLSMPPRLIHIQILGHNLVVHEGTFREHTDCDDAWFLACASHAETIFDVGAHTGDSALLALLSANVKKVVLIEANPEALSLAADNLIRNQVSAKTNFVPAFAGDINDSTVKFWTIGTGAAGSMYRSHAKSAAKANSFIEVPTVTVDSLCDLYKTIPDLMKIDVEGAEYKVLLGSEGCARNGKTRFLVEMHSNPDMPMLKNAACVLDWCRSVNHSAWYLKEGSRCESPAQIQHRGRCHLLLQPSMWTYPGWLKGIKQSADLEVALSYAVALAFQDRRQ